MAKRKKKRAAACVAVAVLLVGGVIALYDSNNVLDAERFDLYFEALPAAFEGFRIVHISDLHEKEFGEDNRRLLKAVMEAEPDIICITGDMVNTRTDFSYVSKLAPELAKLAPTYFVTGNHEFATRRFSEMQTLLEAAGVIVLRNRTVVLERGGASISLVGLEDLNGPADMLPSSEVVARARQAAEDPFLLCLSHRHDRFEEYVSLGVDLVLVGHSHGGLIRLPFTDGLLGPGGVLFPSHTNGIYEQGGTVMLASRGLGGGEMLIRVMNRPHLPVITLHSGNG